MSGGHVRLGLAFFAPMACVAVMLLLILPGRLNSVARAGAHQRAISVADVLGKAAAVAVEFEDAEHGAEVLATIAGDPEVLRAALRGDDGNILAVAPPGGGIEAWGLDGQSGKTRVLEIGDELHARAPVIGRGGTRGSLLVVFSMRSLVAQQRQNLLVSFVAAAVALAVGLAFSVIAASFVARGRRAEASLNRSERNLRGLIETSPDAMIVHGEGQILYANPAANRLLAPEGGPPLTGGPAGGVVPTALAPEGAQAEMMLATPHGQIAAEVRSLPTVFDGRPALLTVLHDVTEKRRMQAQLLFSDRMASVGTLATGVAHEINNPMAYVVANLEFALGGLSENVIAVGDIKEALSEALEGAGRVTKIVKDLRTFARADDEERRPVSVQAALDLSIQMTWSAIRHQARLTKTYEGAPLVLANESRLGQVFVNLIVNATQALEGRPDAEIEISTRTDGQGRAVVAVRDNGNGIPAATLRHIFDPFFTTKPVGVGTGLGLAICHNIVTGLGGTITVDSLVGAGTTFTITLPGTGAAAPALVAAPPPPAEPIAARVLVIDDEPMIGMAVKRTLGKAVNVTTTLSAADALHLLDAGARFDLILCDVMMPVMTGMDLHAELHRKAPHHVSRMVFLTGAVTNQCQEFLDRARRPHLEKPFDPAHLRRFVKDFIEDPTA